MMFREPVFLGDFVRSELVSTTLAPTVVRIGGLCIP